MHTQIIRTLKTIEHNQVKIRILEESFFKTYHENIKIMIL